MTRQRAIAEERHDDAGCVVKLVRHPDGTTRIITIRCPHPWVYRLRYLCPEDLD